MPERRPSLKKPGVTATGRQWQTIETLRSDGWFVLEADPQLWSDEEAARVAVALHARRAACRTPEQVALAEEVWAIDNQGDIG